MKSKSGLRAKFKTNRAKETEGVWLEFKDAPNEDGTIPALLLRRTGSSNIEHGLEVERLTAPYRGRTMTREENMYVTREAFIKTGVVGWRNVQDDEGKDMEFNLNSVAELFTDMNDVYLEAIQYANNIENYKDDVVLEGAKGN